MGKHSRERMTGMTEQQRIFDGEQIWFGQRKLLPKIFKYNGKIYHEDDWISEVHGQLCEEHPEEISEEEWNKLCGERYNREALKIKPLTREEIKRIVLLERKIFKQ